MGGKRGRLIPLPERSQAVSLIQEANQAGARLFKCCDVVGVSTRTFFRWQGGDVHDRRKGATKSVPKALSDAERAAVVAMACSKRFADETPAVIVATLLEEGIYLASESTFYRCLRAEGKVKHRRETKPGRSLSRPPERVAIGPNEVWCWDITWLRSPVNGRWFYAYAVIDLWSRALVGWEVHDRESADIAATMFERLKREHGVTTVYLHSDNGNAMTASTMLETLHRLGVVLSTSRPGVSDDNAFIESFFKTVKYTAGYPVFFKDLEHARWWFAAFVNWYNNEHRHSAIGYVTPQQRHAGTDLQVFEKRNATIARAHVLNPLRWSRGPARHEKIAVVRLNAPPPIPDESCQRTA
jgi:transposase InsO family protein